MMFLLFTQYAFARRSETVSSRVSPPSPPCYPENNDCLIASVAYRLKVPLYTHNLKDMTPIIGNLAVKPYA